MKYHPVLLHSNHCQTLPVGASTVTSLPESLESSQKEGNKSYSQDFKGSLRSGYVIAGWAIYETEYLSTE